MAAEVVKLVQELDPKSAPSTLKPALERLADLLFNRHHKKTAEDHEVLPKLVVLLDSDNTDVLGGALLALANFAFSNWDKCGEIESLTHNRYLPLLRSHPSLKIRAKAADLISRFLSARVWVTENEHIQQLPNIIVECMKSGDPELVIATTALLTRVRRLSLFKSELFDSLGLEAVLDSNLQNTAKPELVLATLYGVNDIGRPHLKSNVDPATFKQWTQNQPKTLALEASAALCMIANTTENHPIFHRAMDELTELLKKLTATFDPTIEQICHWFSFILFSKHNVLYALNNGTGGSLYRVFEEIVKTSTVFQYVAVSLECISYMWSVQEVQEVMMQGGFFDTLMTRYEIGDAEEFWVLTLLYKACVLPNAKTILPVKQIEHLITPLMMGKAGTPNALMAILTLAALVDSDKTRAFSYGEAALATMKHMCALVKSSLSHDTKNRDNRWKVDIVLAGVTNLAVNERNQVIFGEAGIVPTLIDVLHAKASDKWLYVDTVRNLKNSQKYALLALMNLAFHPENSKRYTEPPDDKTPSPKQAIQSLLADTKTELARLTELNKAQSEEGKELGEKIKSLESVLFILESHNKKAQPPVAVAQPDAKSGPSVPGNAEAKVKEEERHIMISYQWGAQPTVIKLAHKLKTVGHKIWLDVEQMQGSTLEAMANAVEQASVVLICVSQKYKDSPNCRLEGEYAANLHKKVLFLKMQDYQPDGWLGIMLGARLWYNFYEHERFEESVAAVAAALGHIGSAVNPGPLPAPPSVAPPVPPPSVPPAVPVSADLPCQSWTEADVDSWLQANNLSQYGPLFRQEKITGKAIAELVKWRVRDDMGTLVTFLKDLGITPRGDILVLTAALHRLHQ